MGQLPVSYDADRDTQFVTPDDVAASIPCGGDAQPAYLDWSEKTLLPALREAFA